MKKCFDLIIKKEDALAIIRGEKTVDYRPDSAYYCKKFFDEKKEEAMKNGEEVDSPFDDDVDYIHFHNNENTWFLDVEIDIMDYVALDQDTKQMLNEWYNSCEIDDWCVDSDSLDDDDEVEDDDVDEDDVDEDDDDEDDDDEDDDDEDDDDEDDDDEIYFPFAFYFVMGDVIDTNLSLPEKENAEADGKPKVLDLVCSKKDAFAIFDRKKKVLARLATYTMDKLFWDDDAIDEDGEEGDWKDYDMIHLHDGSNQWFLDVDFKDIMRVWYNEEGKKMLNADFKCHDFDEICDESNENEEEIIPTYFILLGKIIKTNLKQLRINKMKE